MRLLLPVFLLLLSSCVSKKNYLATVNDLTISQDSLQVILENQLVQIDTLQAALSFERGSNHALFVTQERLQDRLDFLQLEIDNLNQNASSAQSNTGQRINQLNAEIDARQSKIDQIKALIDNRNSRLGSLQTRLADTLTNLSIETELYDLRIRNGQLVFALNEDLLFSSGSTSRLLRKGETVLEETVLILNSYPEMRLHVIGHTDNQPVNRQSLDNWQYSALRAVSVVKFLTEGVGLSPNRVLAASNGKFLPKTSNETAEGRSENRRVELLIFPSDGDLERDLLRILNKN